MTSPDRDVDPGVGDEAGAPVPPAAPRRAPAPRRGSFTGRALVLALVAVGLLVSLAMPVRSWFAQRAQIASLRADVEAAEQRVSDLQVQKERWDDPAFVAAEARRRLHFVLPGEVGYVALGVDRAAAGAAADAGPKQPWFGTLWQGLQQADDHASLPPS